MSSVPSYLSFSRSILKIKIAKIRCTCLTEVIAIFLFMQLTNLRFPNIPEVSKRSIMYLRVDLVKIQERNAIWITHETDYFLSIPRLFLSPSFSGLYVSSTFCGFASKYSPAQFINTKRSSLKCREIRTVPVFRSVDTLFAYHYD